MTGDVLERRVAASLERVLLAKADQTAARHDDAEMAIWRRVPVADGIELHVREDSIGAREQAVVAMREAIRAAIGRG